MPIGGDHARPSQWLMSPPTAQTSLGPLPPTPDAEKNPGLMEVHCEPSQCSTIEPRAAQISFFEVPHILGDPVFPGMRDRFSNGRFFEVYPKEAPGTPGKPAPTRNTASSVPHIEVASSLVTGFHIPEAGWKTPP